MKKVMVVPWEETENYIRSGHKNFEDFDPETFRTIDIDVENGIKAMVAKPKNGNTIQIVSYLFDKNKGWTLEKAIKWFEEHLNDKNIEKSIGVESFNWAKDVFKLYKHIAEKNNAKIWKVRALHVGTTGNKTKFTEEELKLAARSLAWRPVNINHPGFMQHEKARYLPFPDNAVISAEYEDGAIEALVCISDLEVNKMIESGEINKASVEWIARDIYRVNGIEPHGLVFISLALLTKDVQPGDPLATIILENNKNKIKFDEERLKESLDIILKSPARHILYPYFKKLSKS